MSTPAVDRDALVGLLDGNPELIVTIIDSFLDDCPSYMETIRWAVKEEDTVALEREAHGLKGAAGSLRAKPVTEAAQELEQIGHSGDFSDAESALETLEDEVERLKQRLRALKKNVERR